MHPFMSPAPHNDADVSDEMREKALQRTGEILRKLEEIRRSLELPVDQLPIVIETYGKNVIALLAEEERKKLAERTQRLPLTMRSENRDYLPVKILPGQVVAVIGRPQVTAFRPEDIAIHGDRSRWRVHDIKVANRTQFASYKAPVPGTEFGPGGILEHLRLETASTAMDIALVVEYVGPEEGGEFFEATVVGTAI